MSNNEQHIPVLKREVMAALQIKHDGLYLDATLGRGGHAAEICQQLGKAGRLVAIDRDPRAVELGKQLFVDDKRVTVLHGEFADMDNLLEQANITEQFDGVLLDLGVSSPQLDQAERGFSFMRDGALDMRMNPNKGVSAAEWLAYVDEAELVDVLFTLGEEKFARRIARTIVETRIDTPINTTLQLAKLIDDAVPKKDKNKHPATRTFQAIRIYVNGELDQINEVLPKAVAVLKEQGRLAVISFHSLEDRIVKRFMRKLSTPNLPPKSIPVTDEHYLTPLELVGRAVKPSAEEISDNARARSSVLRVAQRTAVAYAEVSYAR